MSLYGTVTRLAPAGRHPPEPSHQIHTFMKNPFRGRVLSADKLQISSKHLYKVQHSFIPKVTMEFPLGPGELNAIGTLGRGQLRRGRWLRRFKI